MTNACTPYRFIATAFMPEIIRAKSKIISLVDSTARDRIQWGVPILPTKVKVDLIKHQYAAGFRKIEITSFVNPKRVAQMRDAEDVADQVIKLKHQGVLKEIKEFAVIANMQGLERAIRANIFGITVAISASELFSYNNIGIGIEESLEMYDTIIKRALEHKLFVRMAISCCWGSPLRDEVFPEMIKKLVDAGVKMGCQQILLCDTNGVAKPKSIRELIDYVSNVNNQLLLGCHLHHADAQAGAENAITAMNLGIENIDVSIGGGGGCPVTLEAGVVANNIAIETLLPLLSGMSIHTGISYESVLKTKSLLDEEILRANALHE